MSLQSSTSISLILLTSLASLSGCATVADLGAGMLGPDAVNKVQHKRQAKEIKAVTEAGDLGRATEMCSKGMDQNGLQLKKDLHQNVCESYANMMVSQVEGMSCEEFNTTRPTLLRYSETVALNKVSDARASQCKASAAAQAKIEKDAKLAAAKAEEDARLSAEAAEREKVLAKLFESKDREEYGKICKDAELAKKYELSRESRKAICAEHVRLSVENVAQAECSKYAATGRTMYDDVMNTSGLYAVGQVEVAWAKRSVTCEDWNGFFNEVASVKSSQYRAQRAFELLLDFHKVDSAPTVSLLKKATKKSFFKSIPDENRSEVSNALAGIGMRDNKFGTCKQFASLLSLLGEEQGKYHVMQLLTERKCKGYYKKAEAMLVADSPHDREEACYYLAKYGKRSSIKKMQTLSYTDSHEYNYSYPVREACRDAYGKLKLKLDQ